MVTLTVELSEELANALAQLVKRVGFYANGINVGVKKGSTKKKLFLLFQIFLNLSF